MRVCIYVCVRVYVYVCMYACMHVCVYVCMYVWYVCISAVLKVPNYFSEAGLKVLLTMAFNLTLEYFIKHVQGNH